MGTAKLVPSTSWSSHTVLGSEFFARANQLRGLSRDAIVSMFAAAFPKADSIGFYAGTCGGAVGSSALVGVDSRVQYHAQVFKEAYVITFLRWLTGLGVVARP